MALKILSHQSYALFQQLQSSEGIGHNLYFLWKFDEALLIPKWSKGTGQGQGRSADLGYLIISVLKVE